MPQRPTRPSRLRGRLTRATTDLHREARPARAASGASTLHQPLRPLRAGLPLGPSPHDAAPTPSLSQWRSELRRPDGGREGLASFVGARISRNGPDQWLAATGLSTPPCPIASPLHRVVRKQPFGSLPDHSARERNPKRCRMDRTDNQIPPRDRILPIRNKKYGQHLVENLERQQHNDNPHPQRRD